MSLPYIALLFCIYYRDYSVEFSATLSSTRNIAMLKHVQIQNYRGLKNLELTCLNQINLIGGRNKTGKTTLLEALFLLLNSGNPQFLINPNVTRLSMHSTQSHTLFNTMWKPLFHELTIEKNVKINAHHSSKGSMESIISCKPSNSINVPLDKSAATTIAHEFDDWLLQTEFFLRGNKHSEGILRLVGNELKLDHPTKKKLPVSAIIIDQRESNIGQDADRLQNLIRLKQTHSLIEVLRVIEPNLTDVQVLFDSGVPIICIDIGLSELVPLTLMGDGMVRVNRFILAMMTVGNGVVLVDEIENGFHYSLMPEVWRRIDKVCKRLGTQIIGTTHSRECVEAAHESLPPDSYSFHRLEIHENANSCVSFPSDALDAVFEQNFEIR